MVRFLKIFLAAASGNCEIHNLQIADGCQEQNGTRFTPDSVGWRFTGLRRLFAMLESRHMEFIPDYSGHAAPAQATR
jgi:hypothetical protein